MTTRSPDTTGTDANAAWSCTSKSCVGFGPVMLVVEKAYSIVIVTPLPTTGADTIPGPDVGFGAQPVNSTPHVAASTAWNASPLSFIRRTVLPMWVVPSAATGGRDGDASATDWPLLASLQCDSDEPSSTAVLPP